MSEEDLTKLLVRVDTPDVKTQKCVVLSLKDTVWAAKQVVLDKLNQELPNNHLNYGLYLLPSVLGKLGKYMDDGRCLGDYVLHGHVPRLEMRYKKRDYSIQVSLKGKDIAKANSKANQRKFVENVVQGNTKKIEKLLEAGIDPNFITEDGNTPLGIACGRNSNIQVIMPLLSNGAHIDFRGREGLTPLHRAALGGNSAAIKILLSYGASPNYRDMKGLTPLYHTAIMGDDTACCESLLRYRAELGIRDHGGWTELHQVTKYGHLDHANLLIKYGADLHTQNNAGNTPLHVAASHGQYQLAMLLMTRGSDRAKLNFSSQLPAQVAILCGHHSLSAEISNFRPDQIETITEPPDYHPGARQFDRNLFDMEKTRSEVGPSVLPSDAVVDSLAQEWTDKDADSGREDLGGERGRGGGAELLWSKNAPGSSISIPSMTGGFTLQPHHSIETADSESLSSYDRDSIHSTSTAGGGTPGPNTPQSHHRRQPTFATQRERLYRAGPGRYVALEDVEPVQSDDIPLRRGMEVEVVFIGKGGYWEGRAGGRQGWFPARAIQEITDDNDSGVFSEYSMKSALPMASLPEYPPAVSSSIQQQQPQQADWSTAGRRDMDVGAVTNVTGAGRVNTVQQPELSSNTQLHQSIPTEQYHVREVVMKCGPRGFGFAMRGVKATKAVKFTPTPQVPALQYIGNVESGGSADLAGLRTGDFLLEINYHNVTYCTHDDVVNIIRQGGKTLQLKVITPVLDHTLRTSVQLQQQVEVVNTTNSLDRQDLMRRDKLPVSLPANSKPPPLSEGSSHMTLLQRETVIDDVPRQPTKGQESPSLERINQSGWDSSQDEAGNTPGTPNHTQKFSYLQPGMSLPLMRQHSPPKKPKTQSPSQSGMMPVSSAKNEPVQTVSTSTAADKSYTLPPQKSYPPLTGVPDSADEEEEEESEFTKALRKGKEKLVNSPAIRKRSSTMPSRPRNTVQRGHFASREQSNSPFTSARSSTEKTAPAIKQPLAAAIMRKIDSIQIGDDRDRSSDEEDSFSKTPPMRIKSHSQSVRKEKAAPAPKPKPQVRRANTVVDPSSMTDANTPSESCKGKIEDISIHHGMQLIRGSSGDVPIHSKREREDKEQGEQSGRMDWKSMLRPVKRTESGRASPDPYDRNRSRSNSNQSPRKGQLGSGYDTTDNRTQFGVESDHLPPPLPAISNRLSMEILNLPPPDNFVSIPGVETGETSTDDIISHDIIPPPLHDRSSRVSPSPPPPPPPDSSPPREPFDHTKFAGVKFTERNKTGFMAPPTNDEEVPSPLPSPMNPSSFDSDVAEPEAILPPQEFVPDREEYGNKGFEILTPPGFEVPTPPVTTNHAGDKMEPDLDDAIRQLQLLSEDLTTRPAGDSKVTSPSGQYLHDASLTRPDTLAPNVSPEQMTIADSPAYTPPVRSRSSTSSSNVSSLPREPEPWPPEITTKTQTHAPVAAGYRVKLMLEWEVEDVCQWLEEIGLGEHCPQFRENEILGEHLLELTKEELAELGVKKIGHKKTFLTKVKELIPSS